MDTHLLSMLVSVSSKINFWTVEYIMFQRRGDHVLKGAYIKGKNMFPIGSIFFPLKIAHMKIENNFTGH